MTLFFQYCRVATITHRRVVTITQSYNQYR